MANEIACSTSALGADIREIQQAYEAVVKKKDEVKVAVDSLNGMWKGAAHDVFAASFANDYESISNLCKTISEIISCLNFARAEYDKCEQQVRDAVASIQI